MASHQAASRSFKQALWALRSVEPEGPKRVFESLAAPFNRCWTGQPSGAMSDPSEDHYSVVPSCAFRSIRLGIPPFGDCKVQLRRGGIRDLLVRWLSPPYLLYILHAVTLEENLRASAKVIFVSIGTAAMALLTAAPASATTTAGTLGSDISWPQCNGSTNTASPSGAKFGIVGVNGGKPATQNPCLLDQFKWAAGLTGFQAPQLYVNTADPGNTASDWPAAPVTSGVTDPYGTCAPAHGPKGANDQACAFEYGVEQAQYDFAYAKFAGASTTTWWLDVETANSWQSRRNLDMNQAVLLGMYDFFTATPGVTVGVYSTKSQWGDIVGTLQAPALSSLGSVPQWIPGLISSTATGCNTSPKNFFSIGPLVYEQYTTTYDYDVVC